MSDCGHYYTSASCPTCDSEDLRERAEKAETELAIMHTLMRQIRDGLLAIIEDWKAQASADEAGFSYRRGNNDFNEGAACVFRKYLPDLEDLLKGNAS